jgi:hypothetical protein
MISSINDIYSQGRAGARVKSLNPGINGGGGEGINNDSHPNSSKKCLWWMKAHLNLNLQAYQQSKFKVHSFYYSIISTSKMKASCYFVVVFMCTVQCFTKIFFDLTALGDL